MPLDWLNTPIDKSSVSELIARKRRAKAIEALREQFQQQIPTVSQRLQLADLLVMAGREQEATPILIGLADEFASDGFVAKAVAILKRVERFDASRTDIQDRLARLVERQLQLTPTLSGPVRVARSRTIPELGIEEFGEDTDLDAGPAGAEAPEPDAVTAEAGGGGVAPEIEPETESRADELEDITVAPEVAPGVVESEFDLDGPIEPRPEGPLVEAGPAVEPESEAAPTPQFESEPGVEPEGPPDAEGDAEAPATKKIRSVFRRFLASLPGSEGDEPSEEGPVGGDVESAADSAVGSTGDGEPTRPSEVPAEPEDGDTARVETEGGEPAALAVEPLPDSSALPGGAATREGETLAEALGIPSVPSDDRSTRESGEPLPAASVGVGARLKGAFRRLFSATSEEGAGSASGPAADAGLTSLLDGGPSDDALLAELTEEDSAESGLSDDVFQEQVLDLIQDVLHRSPGDEERSAAPGPQAAAPGAGESGLVASPIFRDLAPEELLAVLRGLGLRTFEPGDVVVSEGEPGNSLFIVTTGSVRVFVGNPTGRNIEVAELHEGDFFGELSCLSGRPRNATITAATACELLELDKPTMDDIARAHPRVRDRLEAIYLERASSPETAAVRAVDLADADAQQRAIEVLEAHFGQSRWDPRMRLRLADVLWRSGKDDEAIPILIGLADDLTRSGYHEKAIAILKKIERMRRRHVEEVSLAPLKKEGRARSVSPPPRQAPAAPLPPPARSRGETSFKSWVVDLVRESVQSKRPTAALAAAPASPAALQAYGSGLKASPLFEDFSEDELLAVIQGMRLLAFRPGDIILSEGEPGASLFVLTTGTVHVLVRNASGHNVRLCVLEEGAFFGEIAALSGKPRTATITAAAPCELLELDRPNLDRVIDIHPRVKDLLEEVYLMRVGSPDTARVRGEGSGGGHAAP